MKFEIDLNNILGDDYGTETLGESIRRQVIENITNTLKKSVTDKINSEVNSEISKAVKEGVADRMKDIIENVLTTEYQTVTKYGDKDGPKTTFREMLVKTVNEQMVYKKTHYESDRNLFTKSVDSVISENLDAIKKEYKKIVDESIAKEAFSLAINTLKTKLGI